MSTRETLFEILQEGTSQLNIALNETQAHQLVQYVELLHQWNQTYNLTAVRDPSQMMRRHVLDSLSVIAPLSAYLSPQAHLADIGTGGGIPGIILALMLPEWQVSLVESVNKKCRFMTQVILQLGLSARVNVVNERVEHWQPKQVVKAVICRALAEPERFLRLTKPLMPKYYFAMTATLNDAQLAQITKSFNVKKHTVNVPFSDAKRYLYVFRPLVNAF